MKNSLWLKQWGSLNFHVAWSSYLSGLEGSLGNCFPSPRESPHYYYIVFPSFMSPGKILPFQTVGWKVFLEWDRFSWKAIKPFPSLRVWGTPWSQKHLARCRCLSVLPSSVGFEKRKCKWNKKPPKTWKMQLWIHKCGKVVRTGVILLIHFDGD